MIGVSLQNVTKSYKGNEVVKNCCLKIDKPGVYLLAGPNGAGKSVILEMIGGLRKETSGEILVHGVSADEISVKMNRGFLTQQDSLRKNNYVYEEIDLIIDMFGIKGVDKRAFLKEYGLEKYYNFRTKKLSGGTKRRLQIALTFLPRQNLVILDEPVSGLDTNSRDEIWNMIVEYARENIVIVADHYLNQAAEYADFIYLLNEGNIIVSGESNKLVDGIGYDTVVKVRKDHSNTVDAILQNSRVNYKLLNSGTVNNYYLKSNELNEYVKENLDKVSVRKKIDFEEIYFFHTSKRIGQEEK
ncbi:MAG: ATP-binding cassette domain-containing protein [Anaerorhabdus sp.]